MVCSDEKGKDLEKKCQEEAGCHYINMPINDFLKLTRLVSGKKNALLGGKSWPKKVFGNSDGINDLNLNKTIELE